MLNITNFFVTLAEDQTTTENVGMDLIRLIFGVLSRYVYDFIAKITDIFYDIALVLNVNGEGISKLANNITDKLFVVILIYMIFRGTITMLSYLVDPESFQDKSKGGATFIKKVLISIVLLISINPIFNLLGTIQADIIDSDIVTNLFNGNKTNTVFETDGGQTIYFMSMSPRCDDGYLVATFSKGEHLSLETLKPFIQPYGQTDMANLIGEPVYYCGADMTDLFNGNYNDYKYIDSDPDSTYQTMSGILSPRTSAMDYLGPSVYNSTNGTWPDQHEYNIDFNFFFCLVVGIVILLVLISFTFDVVIRAFNLVVLKVLAPVPIIAYMSPKGKDAEMLGIWIKKVISTWASLFIRLIALEFALAIISIICDGGVLPDNSFGFIESLFVIFGALMFAKKLPQLLEEIIPGFKLSGGFELNPFKRISNEALGGKAALGLGAGALAAGLAGVSNAITGVENNLTGDKKPNFGWQRGASVRDNLKRNLLASRDLGGGLLKTSGSVVAGAGSAGFRAFSKTSKDGRFFNGMKQGHLESQFAKQQREDLTRKGSTYFGRLSADANRFIGRENAAQRMNREILEDENTIKAEKQRINAEKTRLQNERDDKVKVYSRIKSNIDSFKSRMDSSGKVEIDGKTVKIKDEIDKLEWMKNSDFSADVEIRRAEFIKRARSASKPAFDKEISDATNYWDQIIESARKAGHNEETINKYVESKNNVIDEIKSRYETKFNSDAISSITAESIKQEKLDEQSDYIDKLRNQFASDIKTGKSTDEVAKQIYANIEEIRAKDSEVADKVNIFGYKDGHITFNKGATYAADDQIKIVSNDYDKEIKVQEEKLYRVNIDEQDIERRKADIKYVKAMADNAAQKVTSPQPENWLSSADIETSSGYGGYQLHAKSGGVPSGGGGRPPGPPPGGAPH